MHRILVLGGGGIGERHVRCFLQTGRCSVSLCETRDARRAELAARYPLEAAFAALEQVERERWDAVVIATPAPRHVLQGCEFAQRGTALFIEKPLSTTLRSVGALQLFARQSGHPANVAYVYRAHPAVAQMRALLQSEELGPVHLVTVVSGQHFPTFRPDYREIYYATREGGGGVIQDALTHLFDLVQHLVGRYDWVFADWSRQTLSGVEVEDTANVVARLNRGSVLASFTGNQFQAPNETRLEIHCHGGSLRFEVPRHAWAVQRRGTEGWTWSEPLIRERDELFIRQANAFLDVLDGKAEPLCPLEEAEHSLRVNLAALESGKLGRPVRLADAPELFVAEGE